VADSKTCAEVRIQAAGIDTGNDRDHQAVALGSAIDRVQYREARGLTETRSSALRCSNHTSGPPADPDIHPAAEGERKYRQRRCDRV